jgi:hypothetical protein
MFHRQVLRESRTPPLGNMLASFNPLMAFSEGSGGFIPVVNYMGRVIKNTENVDS